MIFNFLKMVMGRIATIIHNASQDDSITKDDILDSLVKIVDSYNDVAGEKGCIRIKDFRK